MFGRPLIVPESHIPPNGAGIDADPEDEDDDDEEEEEDDDDDPEVEPPMPDGAVGINTSLLL